MNNFIKVKSIKSGARKAFKLTENYFYGKHKTSIAITGGEFGKEFAKFISKLENIQKKNLFLTDERITSILTEQNSQLILKIFSKNNFLKNNNFYHFTQSFHRNLILKKNINDIFDVCFLSLGEDGHLAGHFENSKNIDELFCITRNAIKEPKKRISFRIDWLFSSKIIIIAVFGTKKEKALKDLIEGKGIHSKDYKKSINRIVFISDLKI